MRSGTGHSARSLLALVLVVTALIHPQSAQPTAAGTPTPTTPTYFLLTAGGSIVAVTEALPDKPSTPVAITGFAAGETLVGIDVRPQNGLLYALGVNAAANTATLYLLNPQIGFAAAVGTPGQIAFVDGGGNPVDLPDPATVGYGFDFNPAADRIRVVAGSLSFRANPNTGGGVDGDNGGAAGSVAGTNLDGPINGSTTTVDAAAYTNNQANNGGITTLYTLDAASNMFFIQSPPNAGTQTMGQTVTLGGNPLDFTTINGFDIPPGVNAPASNAQVTTGSASAVLNVGGTTGLYRINLVNGVATLVGSPGSLAIIGLAVWSPLQSAIALSADGTSLVRFNMATPGTTTTQAINTASLAAGETLAAIDGRPQTGQLYGLGVNATANTGTLYLVDPQTGAITSIGTGGQIAFVLADGTTPVDLPDPATAGYGMDFNPTVDRVRVTTSTGINFRLNPNNGAPVDGNFGGGAVVGTNPDGGINGLPGGSTGVSATAYTNSVSQLLTGGTTTQYTLDATSDSLYIQSPPNAGTQTSPLPITVGGTLLDFTDINGFDIPPGPSVGTSNTPATGNGYALLTVGGVTGVYRINIATGAATSLGTLGAGTTPTAGLVAWSELPSATLTTATTTVGENVGTVDLTITTTGGSPLVVSYMTSGGTATAGADYTVISGTLVLGTTVPSQTITLPIVNDTDPEGAETVDVQILGADGVSQTATLTIVNQPGISLSAATYTGSEVSGTAVLTVTLSQTLVTTATVQYATTNGTAIAGSDYTAATGTVTFAPGQTSKTITIPILSDPVVDAGEIFIVTLSAPTGAILDTPNSAGVTIAEDAPISTIYLPLVQR